MDREQSGSRNESDLPASGHQGDTEMIRIIIVDDEILSRIGLQSFLDGKEGIVVSGIFGEAEEALHFLEENVVDIVLTDIEMAEMDGLSFIREIRERRLAPGGDYCELP